MLDDGVASVHAVGSRLLVVMIERAQAERKWQRLRALDTDRAQGQPTEEMLRVLLRTHVSQFFDACWRARARESGGHTLLVGVGRSLERSPAKGNQPTLEQQTIRFSTSPLRLEQRTD